MNRQIRMYYDEKGRRQATLAASEKPEDELCDFCCQKSPPYKVYPCKEFMVWAFTVGMFSAEWNACSACAELIDNNRHMELLDRCITIIGHPSARGSMEMIFQEFFKNRIYDENRTV